MARDAAMIDAIISDLRHRISKASDVLNNDRYFNQELLRITEGLALFQKQFDELTNLRENGRTLIEGWRDQIAQLTQDRKVHENSVQIEKLKKLQEQLLAAGGTVEDV